MAGSLNPSLNNSNYGRFGLTLGKEFHGAIKNVTENIAENMKEAFISQTEDLNYMLDAVDFVSSDDFKNLRQTYQMNIFNTQRALASAEIKANGPTPQFDSKF